jgi:hypothetical protein
VQCRKRIEVTGVQSVAFFDGPCAPANLDAVDDNFGNR